MTDEPGPHIEESAIENFSDRKLDGAKWRGWRCSVGRWGWPPRQGGKLFFSTKNGKIEALKSPENATLCHFDQ